MNNNYLLYYKNPGHSNVTIILSFYLSCLSMALQFSLSLYLLYRIIFYTIKSKVSQNLIIIIIDDL